MAGFGKIGWGVNSWGTPDPPEQTAVPEEVISEEVGSGHVLGEAIDAVREDVVFGSLSSFRDAVFSSGAPSSVNNVHIKAFLKTSDSSLLSGTPIARTGVLRDKSWIPDIVPFQRDFLSGTKDLAVLIRVAQRESSDLGAQLLALGFKFSGTDDLPAAIHGFFKDDLPSFLRVTFPGQDDVSGSIHGFIIDDLPAILQPLHLEDLVAVLQPIPSEDLWADVTSIPPEDLAGDVVSIPGADLSASGGGHFPEDIAAFLLSVGPVDLGGTIRAGDSGVNDLIASLNQIGQIQDIGGLIKAAQSLTNGLPARMRVIARGIKNLSAEIHGFDTDDLTATIGSFHASDIRSILYGYVRESYNDIAASIRRTDTAVTDLPVGFLRGIFSGATGAEGLPDLAAVLNSLEFTLGDIQGEIKGFFDGAGDLPTELGAVTPFLNISNFIITLQPLVNLPTSITQVGGFKGLSANVTPSRSVSTSTASGARFTKTATDFRFYLGTTSGIFVPDVVPERTITTTYLNPSQLPDLRATVSGWFIKDLAASIRPYFSDDFGGYIFSYGLSHLSHLAATIQSLRESDLSASIVPFGAFYSLSAFIEVGGDTNELSASIIPGIEALSTTLLAVSTKPFRDLGALINYDSYVLCAGTSLISELPAFIKPAFRDLDNTGDLSATLNSLRKHEDLAAFVEPRKRTRIRVLELEFRASIRSSHALRASLTPVAPATSGLSSSIFGRSHEVDLSASLEVVRIPLPSVRFTPSERVVNLSSGTEKDIFLSFRSQVNNYVYEGISNSLYATDRGTWSIDLSTLLLEDSFFALSEENRTYNLFDIEDFYTLDEAIRAAIVILCERRQSGLGAQINVVGTVKSLAATMSITTSDMLSDLNVSLFPVHALPDISASINVGPGSSGFFGIYGVIKAGESVVGTSLGAEAIGVYGNDLFATIVSDVIDGGFPSESATNTVDGGTPSAGGVVVIDGGLP
jgi:hypothetical protein